jgi:hypothetical protein
MKNIAEKNCTESQNKHFTLKKNFFPENRAFNEVKEKVKQSHYTPRQALRFPRGRGSQISRQSAHKFGKVVSLTHRPPLPPGNIPRTHFCYWLRQP